jgi:hypothetical protein
MSPVAHGRFYQLAGARAAGRAPSALHDEEPMPSTDTTDDLLPIEPDDDEMPIEPDEPAAPDAPSAPTFDPSTAVTPAPMTALAPLPLVEVLPADFKLSPLTKFIPNPELRKLADEAATSALAIAVTGNDGMVQADAALAVVRARLAAIDQSFAEPVATAFSLHRTLTGIRGEWRARGDQAIEMVGRRIFDERKRLEAIAAEEKRKAQEAADRQAREEKQREADAAKAQQAPPAVVWELEQQARTATAPPVATPAAAAPAPLKNSTPVSKHKCRIAGTTGSEEQNPDMESLTQEQRLQIFEAHEGGPRGPRAARRVRDQLVVSEQARRRRKGRVRDRRVRSIRGRRPARERIADAMTTKPPFDAGKIADLATQIADQEKAIETLRGQADRSRDMLHSAETKLANMRIEFTRLVGDRIDRSTLGPDPRSTFAMTRMETKA